MRCPYSVRLKDKYTIMGDPVYRPCGECAICRRNSLMTIQSRAMYEFKKHKYCAFLSLTYDDNHLYFQFKPLGENNNVGFASTCKKHIQIFLDDFRHYVKRHNFSNCDKDFSFLYCTEYGGNFARPHAHILIFGVDFPIAKKIAVKLWKFGFVDSRAVHSSSIRYVCKYINKGAKGKYADLQFHDKGVEKPVVKWSKGLGKGLYYENIDNIRENGFLKQGNKHIFVPPYYKNKIMNYRERQILHQWSLQNLSWIERHSLAKYYGFNSVEDMEKKFVLNAINNELHKNIISKVSVDLEELGD